MSTLAHELLKPPRWRPVVWAAQAWGHMNWRHILLALVIQLVLNAIHPLGGIFFPPTEVWDSFPHLLAGSWLVTGLALIYCVLVADEAFDDGVSPLRAYGSVVAVLVLFFPSLNRMYFSVLLERERFLGVDEGPAQLLWWSLVALYEGGFGLSIYAYWRVTQRAMRRVQEAEAERLRNEHRVQTAQLLALQSRVDPQLLFDALRRVGELHVRDTGAADALLADMIALLRSMQPSAGIDTSTVEREFGLVRAWVRLMRSAGHEDMRVELHAAPGAMQAGIAPMLVLPMLRAVLAVPGAALRSWQMGAAVAEGRLVVALGADDADAHAALGEPDLAALRDRLARVFGPSARLTVPDRLASLTLDLPLLLEDANDQCADR
jgi:hypothetical protein